jgi:hypothetical protein
MKNLFYFILGVIFITLISATTVSVMTVKIKKPKYTVVKIVENYEVENYIKNCIKKGYVVKSCSITADRNGGSSLVIMEQY